MYAVNWEGKRICNSSCRDGSLDSGEEIEIEMDESTAKCYLCFTTGDKVKHLWKEGQLPFYQSRTHTFYCGCRGWR